MSIEEQIEFTIKSSLEEMQLLNYKVREFLKRLNIASNVVYKVNLVIEEMITNIIKYSYDDKNLHEINIYIKIDPDQIYIKLIDDGKEFDATLSPDPEINVPVEEMKIGGLGIHIVKHITEDIKYHRDEGKNILHVKLKVSFA